ncbi:unnamed protein product [Symbiodinium sp. CCMP2456]|nr:unnamed protein product [Symbiodinium sp. CCMP2456]
MMREEFSTLLAAQFPHSLEERLPRGEPFPSYFVDSEAAVNPELPEAERTVAFLELERLSVLARSSAKLPTCLADSLARHGTCMAKKRGFRVWGLRSESPLHR